MRLQIASDLHLEFRNGRLPHRGDFVPVRDRDVLVLAGDIGRQRMARYFVERELEISPVIYVPGNHEYYSKQSRGAIDADWRGIAAEHPGLHYLVAERVEIEGVRFWGAPWYSDLWGTTSRETLELVRTGINDFALQWGGSAWTVSRTSSSTATRPACCARRRVASMWLLRTGRRPAMPGTRGMRTTR